MSYDKPMITVHPKRKRKMPASMIVSTRFRVAEYDVTLSTSLLRQPASTIAIWQPARPKGDLPEELKTQFLRGKVKHAQKLADLSQNTVSMMED